MSYTVVKELPAHSEQGIILDQIIVLDTEKSRTAYPKTLRRVTVRVEINGKEVEMTFITNNFKWAASSVAGLYQARWGIEVFFKQLKQSLKLSGFIGYSKNAIQCQVCWLLSRDAAFDSFSRLMALMRSYVWNNFELNELLKFHGTAGGLPEWLPRQNRPILVGFEPK